MHVRETIEGKRENEDALFLFLSFYYLIPVSVLPISTKESAVLCVLDGVDRVGLADLAKDKRNRRSLSNPSTRASERLISRLESYGTVARHTSR